MRMRRVAPAVSLAPAVGLSNLFEDSALNSLNSTMELGSTELCSTKDLGSTELGSTELASTELTREFRSISEESHLESRLTREFRSISELHATSEFRCEALTVEEILEEAVAPQCSNLLSRRLPSKDARSKVTSLSVNTDSTKASSGHDKQIIRLAPNDKIFDFYYWDEVLQEDGDGGKVVVCQPKDPSSPRDALLGKGVFHYVMKIKPKATLLDPETEQQFRRAQQKLLNLAPHDGFMPLHEVLESDDLYYIVMQKATGGPFFGSLLSEFHDGVMPVAALRRVLREILEAVGHVHRQGMLHRDLKPDNMVMHDCIDSGSPTGRTRRVVLIDFDHAEPECRGWRPGAPARDSDPVFGTVRFNAPETFDSHFSRASDLYSVGAILYLLVTGKMPYDDALFLEVWTPSLGLRSWRQVIMNKMREAHIDWKCNPWPSQPLCLDLCSRLLSFEPSGRPASAGEALSHPWFTEGSEISGVSRDATVSS